MRLLVAIAETYLLQHTGALGDLSNNVGIEQGLGKDSGSTMLALDAKLLGLDVDLDRIDLINAALLLGLLENPVSKVIIDTAATFLIILIITHAKLLLELVRKLSLTSLDGFLTHIDGPVIVLNLSLVIDFGGLGLHFLELVVTVDDAILVGAILGSVIVATAVAIFFGRRTILLGLASSLALSLILFTLLGLVLEDEATKFEA